MGRLEDYLISIRRNLDVPTDAEREEIVAEIRDHLVTTAESIEAEGVERDDAVERAIRLMGDSNLVAAAISISYHGQTALFPPRDLIPTAAVWGVWAAGVMAGANYVRLGFQERGIRLMVSAITAQVVTWICLIFLERHFLSSRSDWLLTLSPSLGFAANAAAGYWLYKRQREFYRLWAARNPVSARKTPYAKWWVSIVAVIGTAMTVVFVFYARDLGWVR